MVVRSQKTNTPQKRSLQWILFAFGVFAVLSGLTRSAEETAQNASSTPSNLRNYFDSMPGADFVIGADELMIMRAKNVQRVIEHFAAQDNLQIYEDGSFFITEDFINTLCDWATDIIPKQSPAYSGKCLMMAHALSGNPKGMRYLVMRSKQYDNLKESRD